MRQLFLVIMTLWLVACSNGLPVPTSTLAPTPQPEPTEPVAATAGLARESAGITPTPGPALQEFVTPEGYHALGDPRSPGTIVMYSDVF
jgi:hypothetical protein